jgi:hypothetical protein
MSELFSIETHLARERDHVSGARPDEPSSADLSAIEREWPPIAAELELLDAQLLLTTGGGQASGLDPRRVRRAARRLLAIRRTASGERRPPLASPDLGDAA